MSETTKTKPKETHIEKLKRLVKLEEEAVVNDWKEKMKGHPKQVL